MYVYSLYDIYMCVYSLYEISSFFFYSVFDQINAALVSIKRLLSNAFKNPTKATFLMVVSVQVQMVYQYQI